MKKIFHVLFYFLKNNSGCIQRMQKLNIFLAIFLLLCMGSNGYSSAQDLTTGLVGFLKFENNFVDESSNGNSAVDYNGISIIPHTGSCNNYALSFNGNEQYITIPNISAYDFGIGPFTISHEIKYNTPQPYFNYSILINKIEPGCPYPYPGINMFADIPYAGVIQGRTSADNLVLTNPSMNLRDGNWHSIVFTREPDLNGTTCTLKIYVDGLLNNTSSGIPLENVTNNTDIFIGANCCVTTSQNYIGELDNYRLYNRALTAADVQELHQVQINNLPALIVKLQIPFANGRIATESNNWLLFLLFRSLLAALGCGGFALFV